MAMRAALIPSRQVLACATLFIVVFAAGVNGASLTRVPRSDNDTAATAAANADATLEDPKLKVVAYLNSYRLPSVSVDAAASQSLDDLQQAQQHLANKRAALEQELAMGCMMAGAMVGGKTEEACAHITAPAKYAVVAAEKVVLGAQKTRDVAVATFNAASQGVEAAEKAFASASQAFASAQTKVDSAQAAVDGLDCDASCEKKSCAKDACAKDACTLSNSCTIGSCSTGHCNHNSCSRDSCSLDSCGSCGSCSRFDFPCHAKRGLCETAKKACEAEKYVKLATCETKAEGKLRACQAANAAKYAACQSKEQAKRGACEVKEKSKFAACHAKEKSVYALCESAAAAKHAACETKAGTTFAACETKHAGEWTACQTKRAGCIAAREAAKVTLQGVVKALEGPRKAFEETKAGVSKAREALYGRDDDGDAGSVCGGGARICINSTAPVCAACADDWRIALPTGKHDAASLAGMLADANPGLPNVGSALSNAASIELVAWDGEVTWNSNTATVVATDSAGAESSHAHRKSADFDFGGMAVAAVAVGLEESPVQCPNAVPFFCKSGGTMRTHVGAELTQSLLRYQGAGETRAFLDCITEDDLCNGYSDCIDGADESAAACPTTSTTTALTTATSTEVHTTVGKAAAAGPAVTPAAANRDDEHESSRLATPPAAMTKAPTEPTEATLVSKVYSNIDTAAKQSGMLNLEQVKSHLVQHQRQREATGSGADLAHVKFNADWTQDDIDAAAMQIVQELGSGRDKDGSKDPSISVVDYVAYLSGSSTASVASAIQSASTNDGSATSETPSATSSPMPAADAAGSSAAARTSSAAAALGLALAAVALL